jgi:hypothetical protein
VLRNSFIHDNNNANVPGSGTAELGPPGTGVVIAGGRRDIVTNNVFTNNGSWAVLVVPFIDTGTPPPVAHCDGGIDNWLGTGFCYYADWGNEILGNAFAGNGGFGNPTNGDLGDISDPQPTLPGNCWNGNVDPGGVSAWPTDLQTANATCGKVNQGGEAVSLANVGDPNTLTGQVVCATELLGPCAPDFGMYPRSTTVSLLPTPVEPTMPDPCAGVPTNPWCPPGAPTAVVAQPVGTAPKFTG